MTFLKGLNHLRFFPAEEFSLAFYFSAIVNLTVDGLCRETSLWQAFQFSLVNGEKLALKIQFFFYI